MMDDTRALCQDCGWCCRHVNINVSYHDILRWAKERRLDILSAISYIDDADPKKRGFYITDTVTAPKAPCPFYQGDACAIYETRPRACAEFPQSYTAQQRSQVECPSLAEFEIPEAEAREIRKAQALDFVIAEDRKERLLKILANAREILRLLAEVEEFGADPTEDLYVGGFDSTDTAWTEVGDSPYLDTQNQPTAYVWTATKKAAEGNWSFDDTARPYTDTLNGVDLYVYGQSSSGIDRDSFLLWDGTDWTDAGLGAFPNGSWGWVSVDVSAILDTWAKVDGAELRIEHDNSDDQTDVDAAYLLIDYTEALSDREVSKAESLGISDAPTVGPLLAEASESESLALSDTPTVALADLAASASEGLALSATPQHYTEMLFFRESVTVQVQTPGVQDREISESENLGLSDTATVALATLTISVSDSLGLSDSATVRLLSFIAEAETLDLSDSATVRLLALIAETESLTLADVATVAMAALQVSEAEGLTLSDAVTARLQSFVSAAESLGLSDAASAALGDLAVSEAESLGLSDAAVARPAITVSESELLTLSDSPTLDVGAEPDVEISESESLTLSDSATVALGALEAAAAETLGLSDAATVALEALAIAEAEGLTLSDSATARLLAFIAKAESLTLSDVASAAIAALKVSVAEALTLSDSASLNIPEAGAIVISEAESLTLADTVTVELSALAVSVSETLGLMDSPTVSVTEVGLIAVSVSEMLGLSDAPAAAMADLAVLAAEALTLADSATSRLLSFIGQVESLGLSDAATVGPLGIEATASEGLALTDSPSVFIPGYGLTINVSDGLGMSEGEFVVSLISILLDVAVSDSRVGRVALSDSEANAVTIVDALVGRVTLSDRAK